MRVYKTKEFARTSRKERVSDEELLKAARRAFEGKTDADLGVHLVKQHVSQGNGGRSAATEPSSFMSRVSGDVRSPFRQERQGQPEHVREADIQELAKSIAELSEEQIKLLLKANEWIEIKDDQDQTKLRE